MADLSRTVDIIFKGQDKLTGTTGAVSNSLGDIGDNAANAETKVNNLNDEVTDLGEKPRRSVDGLATAMKALAASLIVKDFIDANVQFETFQRTMTIVTGSAEKAGEEFEYLTELSNTLGLEVLNTAKNYASLAAATRGTALEGQETKEIFEAVSTAMSALGKSSADTEGALLAITQVVSKGKVSMEELRQQLGERVPGALQIAARAMGVTTTELDDLVATGDLAAEEFLPKFAAELKKTFGDVSFVDTYTASLNRLKNSVTAAELQIGAAGGFDVFTKAIQLGTVAVTGAIATFEVFGKSIGALLGAITSGDFSALGDDIDGFLQDAADKTRAARDALLEMNEATKQVATSAEDLLQPIEAQGAYIIYNLEQTEKWGKVLDKTAVDLAKIASNERIAIFEGNVEFGIAKLEADTKRATALIDNLGQSASDSADLIGDLFGSLNDASTFRDKFKIEDAIDLETENRQKLLDLQARQIKSQLRLDRLREENLRNGGATLNVQADGLAPHLEAIWREILDYIQVQVNAGEGNEFLLGPV